MSWVATIEEVEVGFFVPRDVLPEDTETRSFRFIGVAGLHDPIQFSHLRVLPDAEAPTEHFVFNFNGARVTQGQWSRWLEALRPAYFKASACLMLGTHEQTIDVLFAESSSAFATAAAVAAVMYSASWDERDPIPVHVDGETMGVSLEFVDRRLRAKIEAGANAL
jgi:hypothetical protein